MTAIWLTSTEALARLGSRPQTLYANVSRGRIRARPDPADSRRSLYRAEDVDRLAARRQGRRSSGAVAAEAVHWGDPVLPSALSTITDGQLYYRGQSAARLSHTADLDTIARLLWDGEWTADGPVEGETDGSFAAVLARVAARAAADPPSHARSPAALRNDAGSLLALLSTAFAGAGEGPLHARLAARWKRPQSADSLRRALVLLADHELNASTFAVRVTVSTGAAFSAGMLTGLATLSGPLHGMAAGAAFTLVARAQAIGAEAAVCEVLAEGRRLPAFGHPLYPHGDIRAVELLRGLDLPPVYAALIEASARIVGEAPNVDLALAALTAAHRLPPSAPFTLFALARSVGWLAHMLEQAAESRLIRPRARYTGPAIEAADAAGRDGRSLAPG